jgi:Rrf2 family protein
MEIIRRETDYALRCLLYLAKLGKGAVASSRTIAKDEKLPYELLRKIFQRLTTAGLVDSTRGKRGGFKLSIAPREITIKRVLEAVQGPVVVNRCVNDQKCCPNQAVCQFHKGICEMQDQISALLSGSNIEDFLNP